MAELWKPVAGYEGYYEVSNLGRVRSLERVVPGKKKKTVRGRIMRPATNKYGYVRYFLTKDSHTKSFNAHRLVYAAFKGEIPPGHEIDHIDGDKANNVPENLNCLSRQQHLREDAARGRKAYGGVTSKKSALVAEDVQKIKAALLMGESQTVLAERFKVHRATINSIATQRSWKWVPVKLDLPTEKVVASELANTIHQGDSLKVLEQFPNFFADLIYIDPPYNTGTTRGYRDNYSFYQGFLIPRIEAGIHCLAPSGSLFVHLDIHEVHNIKVALDRLLDKARFAGEIIVRERYQGAAKRKYKSMHSTILWYVHDPKNYTFNIEESQHEGDIWEIHKLPYRETSYPTQKPLELLTQLVRVHSNPGDMVLDYFAGSGTTGEACKLTGRNYVLVDERDEAIEVMSNRLGYIAL